MFLPEDVREALQDYDEIMEERRRGNRGGMKAEDPKAMMMRIAQQRIAEFYPQAVGPTTTMLLRAEQRTITASLNSKSAIQLRQVIDAAYKRANLSAPGCKQEQEVAGGSASTIMREEAKSLNEAMQQQMKVNSEVVDKVASERAEDLLKIMAIIKSQADMQAKTIQALVLEVKVLQQKISEWEETILPCIVENLPGMRALPTPESEDEPMHDADRDIPLPLSRQERQDRDAEERGRQQDDLQTIEGEGEVRPVDQSSVIAYMEQVSLKQCCQLVIQSSEGPRRAIRPFRA